MDSAKTEKTTEEQEEKGRKEEEDSAEVNHETTHRVLGINCLLHF